MRILLVEDDEKLNNALTFQLQKENFVIDSCFDGEEALYYIEQKIHDIILLDRMIPIIDGVSILNKMRRNNNNTPVILITALGELQDKIDGLDMGADDYLVKPFAFEELMARIRCVVRRPRKLENGNLLSFGDLVYDPYENRLEGKESSCSLSVREGSLMEALMRAQGQVLSREILLTKVWGMDSDVENGNLDNYIHFLRRRLNSLRSVLSIKTVRGIGYKLE